MASKKFRFVGSGKIELNVWGMTGRPRRPVHWVRTDEDGVETRGMMDLLFDGERFRSDFTIICYPNQDPIVAFGLLPSGDDVG